MLSCIYWLLRKKELVGFFLKTFTARGKIKFTIKLDYGTFSWCPKLIIVLLQSAGWHSQKEDIRVKSDSLFYSICPGSSRGPILCLCRFLEVCVCWMCVIHDYFPVAPLAVMPFDNLAVGWQRSSLLSGWLYPFKINFRKRFSISTSERYPCFPKGTGFCWYFWATIKSSRVTSM